MGLKDMKVNESFSQSHVNSKEEVKASSRVDEACGSSSGGQQHGYRHLPMGHDDDTFEGDRTNDSELDDIMIEELLSYEAEHNNDQERTNYEYGNVAVNDGSSEPYEGSNAFYEPPAMIDIEKYVREETVKDKERVRDRRKKDIHNMIERRRRYNINDRIKELGTLLPKTWIEQMKLNKGTILKASVDYVRLMHKDLARFRKMQEQQRMIKTESQKAAARVWQLEQILKDHGIFPLSEPQAHEMQAAAKIVKDEPNGIITDATGSNNHSDTFSPYRPQNVGLGSAAPIIHNRFDPCMGGQHFWDLGVSQYSSQANEYLMMDSTSPRGVGKTLLSCSASPSYSSVKTPTSEGVGLEMCTKFTQEYAKSCNEFNLSSAMFSSESNSLFY